MQTFIYDSTTCCLCDIDNNRLEVYECAECIDAALLAGCLKEGQVIATPSALDHIPTAGDADNIYINGAGNGYMMVSNAVEGSYGALRKSGVSYTCSTDTLNTTNLTVTGCINGICYTCYATTSAVETAECCACGYTDTRETCIRCDACSYALCCAECCAEACGKCYFEACIDCCIQAYFDCYLKGNINTSNPGRDNSLWVN